MEAPSNEIKGGSKHKTPPIEGDEALGDKRKLVVEERKNATDEEFVEEFKERSKAIANMKQIKLFMKQNKLSVNEPESIRKWMKKNDLELKMALFLEEVEK